MTPAITLVWYNLYFEDNLKKYKFFRIKILNWDMVDDYTFEDFETNIDFSVSIRDNDFELINGEINECLKKWECEYENK